MLNWQAWKVKSNNRILRRVRMPGHTSLPPAIPQLLGLAEIWEGWHFAPCLSSEAADKGAN